MESKKQLTVLYCTYNREYYTGITLPRVIDECRKSKSFKKLYILDDASVDGTEKLIKSIDFDFEFIREKHRNTVWQLNKMRELCNTEFLYGLGNDILIPDGLFDFMVHQMQAHPDYISLMIEETPNLPYINYSDFYIKESPYTSSLGIHRIKKFDEIHTSKRFFGFQPAQLKAKQEHGMKCGWVMRCANTNLDMSPWSKATQYEREGIARILTSQERKVWK